MQFNLLQNSCTSKSTLSSHRGMGISTHMHTHAHACTRVHTYVHVCVHVHVCADVHIHRCMCVQMYMCARTCAGTHGCVHVCTQMHTYMHAHTRTHASSSPTVNLPPQREAMPTTARRCCSADGLVTSCSSDREGLAEGAGGPGRDGKLSSRKHGHRRSPPSRPHSPRRGLWEVGPRPGETEGDSQVLLFAPMRATRLRASTAQEQKGPRAWRPRAWKPDIRGSGANLTGTPRPPALAAQNQATSPVPPQARRDTGTAEMCSTTGGGEGVTHCPRPQASISGPRRCSLTGLALCCSTSPPARCSRDPPPANTRHTLGSACGVKAVISQDGHLARKN